jgi:hypothetical protein
MGIDFIRRAAPSYRKGLDRRRIELGTPDLFTRRVEGTPRAYAAAVQNGEQLSPGDKLCVCLKGEQVIALRGLSTVALVKNPPPDLMSALVKSFGEACGVVQIVHEMASMAEITIC